MGRLNRTTQKKAESSLKPRKRINHMIKRVEVHRIGKDHASLRDD